MAADPLDDYIDRLRQRPNDFDPAVRDRLLAGAMDVIIAPATPCVAPKLGQVTFVLDGVELPVRANIGIHTQPISFIGLPVVAVPVPLEPMPIGVQIIAAPWREDIALRTAYALQHMGVVAAPPPRGI
jgi:Asp-tRNA(Asn)/Glu-tRNA(Gln) amidotransferase A subunit family amidase